MLIDLHSRNAASSPVMNFLEIHHYGAQIRREWAFGMVDDRFGAATQDAISDAATRLMARRAIDVGLALRAVDWDAEHSGYLALKSATTTVREHHLAWKIEGARRRIRYQVPSDRWNPAGFSLAMNGATACRLGRLFPGEILPKSPIFGWCRLAVDSTVIATNGGNEPFAATYAIPDDAAYLLYREAGIRWEEYNLLSMSAVKMLASDEMVIEVSDDGSMGRLVADYDIRLSEIDMAFRLDIG